MKSALSPIAMLLAVAACQPAAETPNQAQARMDAESAAAKTVIDSLAREFATHFNAGHADIVAGFYMENATAMPPNAPMSSGRSAIQSVMQSYIDMKAQLTLTPQAVMANGPLAVERGVYSITFTPPGATAPMTDTGKYMVHWHMVDGKWMIADDIWNSDLPLPPAAPGGR